MAANLDKSSDPKNTLFSYSAGLVGALMVIGLISRAYMWFSPNLSLTGILAYMRRILYFSYYDFLILISFAALMFIGSALAHKRVMLRKLFKIAAMVFATVYGLLLIINVIAVHWISTPLTYQWIYYADLGRSVTPQMALQSVINIQSVTILLVGIVVGLATFCLVKHVAGRRLLVTSVLFIGIYIILSMGHPPKRDAFRDAISNPMTELIASAFAAYDQNIGSLKTEAIDPSYHINRPDVHNPIPIGGKRPNIILIVLESVSAKVVYDRAKVRKSLPNIASLADRGTLFSNAYAPMAESTRAIFTMLSSRYPLLTFRPETYTLSGKKFTSVANRLSDAKYDTAFFMGGEFAFQAVDRFLVDKGFDDLIDVENAGCSSVRQLDNPRFKNIAGIPTPCLVDAFFAWQRQRGDEPYFAIIWANDTHFPYFPKREGLIDSQQKYMASVQDVDAEIGRLVAHLQSEGDLENTVIIITSDHGEAFGEHGNVMHGTTMFEEEVHIPLIVSGPSIDKGTVISRLVNQVDFAPMILDLAKAEPEPSWQGSSPFQAAKARNLYFAATRKGNQAGIRIGDLKYMFNQRTGGFRKFNLARDPGEKQQLPVGEAEKRRVVDMIAAWAQYSEKLNRK